MTSVALAVLNFNGIRHLEALLPTLVDACHSASVPASIIVLDNRSTEPDVAWLRREWPDVRCVVAETNDYLYSYNSLLATLPDDIVVLLNNDVRVGRDFLEPLVRHLRRPDVFAVSPRVYDWTGEETTSGPARLSFKNGMYDWAFDTTTQRTCQTLYVVGACMAVDRRKFLALGGFDRLYYPAYCEDLDLCFRAWRRGWRSIYEPASVIWHRGGGSWSAVNGGRGSAVGLRGTFLFQWASLPFERQKWLRRMNIVRRSMAHALQLDFDWSGMCVLALARWLRVRKHYGFMKVSDVELGAMLARMAESWEPTDLAT